VYERILVPLDGSTLAEAALPHALAVAQKTKAALRFVSVLEPSPVDRQDDWEAATRAWLEDYLEEIAGRVTAVTGVGASTAMLSGLVVEALLAEANACRADLIVLATHGRGAIAREWLGSVADGLMRHSRVPVLLVRPQTTAAPVREPAERPATILVPLDGSELSESALAHAEELGELFSSSYHLTRVVVAIDITAPYLPATAPMNRDIVAAAKAAAAEYLEAHAERMRRRGLRVTTSVAVDAQAAHGILSEAEAVGCDMIAMATHGRNGMRRLVLGSAADKVLRGTQIPLLLYRPVEAPAATA
jgi:nucleotide-binding universal stress UspA family protein